MSTKQVFIDLYSIAKNGIIMGITENRIEFDYGNPAVREKEVSALKAAGYNVKTHGRQVVITDY